jgi:nitrous oxidase accessory protein
MRSFARFTAACLVSLAAVAASAAEIPVHPGDSIAAAVARARAGDTVMGGRGYYEG